MDAECRINGFVLPQLHCSLYTCVVENVCEVLILQVDIIQLHIWKGIWDFQVLVVPEGVLGDRHSDRSLLVKQRIYFLHIFINFQMI